MTASRRRPSALAARYAPFILFGAIVLYFALASPKFLTLPNLVNILVQSSSIGIAAIGMTFVLLTAGIDLSVGAVMYVSAAAAGWLLLGDASVPLPVALVAMVAIGAGWGALNGLLITRFGLAPFIVTLAALSIGRGLGLLITETRAMNLPEGFRGIATAELLGIPSPVWMLALILVVAHLTLTRTPFGRWTYAIGHDPEAARKAGIAVDRSLIGCYVISAVCAVLGGIVLLAQLGAVSPTLGENRELEAIAAAVLGGTSLFGGRGSVFPGTLAGAVMIQTVNNGLVVVNAEAYYYPLITSAIIFLAVWFSASRERQIESASRRVLRLEEP